MVPKSGTGVPKSLAGLSDARFAELLSSALQQELGGSRRASKTIMAWTGVSDHTARSWLNGRKSPSGLHLLGLAAGSSSVMQLILHLTGHGRISVAFDLSSLEAGLEDLLVVIRALQTGRVGH